MVRATVLVKPDQTRAFEEVLLEIRDALAGSALPLHRTLAEGWRVFRSRSKDARGVIFHITFSPAIAGQDYSLVRLIEAAHPNDSLGASRLLKKYGDLSAGFNLMHLSHVVSMGSDSGPTDETQPPPLEVDAQAVLPLTGDAANIVMLIRPGMTAAFESVLMKARDALVTSQRRARRMQAAGWRVYRRIPLPGPQQEEQGLTYMMVIDPVIRGQEYDISKILEEAFPNGAQAFIEQYRNASGTRAVLELDFVSSTAR